MSKNEPATRDTIENKFTKVPRYFIERGRYLTPPAKWVWVILKTHENNTTRRIFPSHATIEDLSGLSRVAVSKALKELEHFSWIIKDKAGGRSTNYTLNYWTHYTDKALEAIVEPIPGKEEAKQYKDFYRVKRARKNGTFDQKTAAKLSRKKVAGES